MYNQPTNFPHKLKKPQKALQPLKANTGFNAALNGGSTADITTDKNGMTGVSPTRSIPYSPASARTVEMQSRGNPPVIKHKS